MARSSLKAVLVVLYLSACIQAAQPSIQTESYNVEVMTSDENGAGTDANVFIKIYGKLENTKTIPLTNPAGNPFERGSHDTFSFVAKNVGPIKKLAVMRDTTGLFSEWKLDEIVVNTTGSSYTFAFNQWIPANQWIERME